MRFKPQLQTMVAVLIYAGLRREELFWLTLVNVSLTHRHRGNSLVSIHAKTINSQSWQPKTAVNHAAQLQLQLKTLGVNPWRAMQQIVDYKNDPGNGYSKTFLCFLLLFIASNQPKTYYLENNNDRHFAFNADEQFLPDYQFADETSNNCLTNFDTNRFLCHTGDNGAEPWRN